jgi:RNA polymerase sigma-70 factor (ECF subfamily)
MLKHYLSEKKEAHYRMAYTYTKNSEDALDVLQDSIEKALRAIKKNGPPDHLNSWFYKILIRTAIDHIRKHKRTTLMSPEDLESMMTSEDDYKNFDLEAAMDKLPAHYKTLIVLRYFEDLKIKDIGNILDENVNTVKTRLYRALNFLKIELEEDDDASA